MIDDKTGLQPDDRLRGPVKLSELAEAQAAAQAPLRDAQASSQANGETPEVFAAYDRARLAAKRKVTPSVIRFERITADAHQTTVDRRSALHPLHGGDAEVIERLKREGFREVHRGR